MAVRYILGISILVFQNLLAKTEYTKHLAGKITFNEAAGQDNNITGETASEQVILLECKPFCYSEHTWDMERRG